MFAVTPGSETLKDQAYFRIYYQGTCGIVDMWSYPNGKFMFSGESGEAGGVRYFAGDSLYTIDVPATAANLVTVAAYTTRKEWFDIDGQARDDGDLTMDDIVWFSSRGPLVGTDPVQKPTISAPGAYLISAKSATSDPDRAEVIDDLHVAMAGTSMASPHTTGIVALMLQAHPELSYSQIITYLHTKSRADTFVGTAPNDNWGYGKVNASALVAAVLADYPPGGDFGDYSGITIEGITGSNPTVSPTQKTFTIRFPRPVTSTTVIASNLFIASSVAASAMSVKSAWNSTQCNPASARVATLESVDAQTATLTLQNGIGYGDFVFCVSPNVRDSNMIKFGGKTAPFAGGASGGGCALSGIGGSRVVVVMLMLFCVVVLIVRSRCVVRSPRDN